jgi:hypothetical protein
MDPDLRHMTSAELINPPERDFEVGATCTVVTEDDIKSEPESEPDEDYLTEIYLIFLKPDPPVQCYKHFYLILMYNM